MTPKEKYLRRYRGKAQATKKRKVRSLYRMQLEPMTDTEIRHRMNEIYGMTAEDCDKASRDGVR